jgi:hypothetical protein
MKFRIAGFPRMIAVGCLKADCDRIQHPFHGVGLRTGSIAALLIVSSGYERLFCGSVKREVDIP